MSAMSPAKATLIHSYTFEGNAQDQTGNADGTVTGAMLTNDRFGNADSAYAFSNDGDAIQMTLTTGHTVTYAVWAKLDTGLNFARGSVMLFNTGPYNSGPDLYFVEPNTCNTNHPGGIYWNVWDSCGSPLVEPYPAGATDGQFHFYAVVVDQSSSSTTLYIDGSQVGSGVYHAPGTSFTAGNSGAGQDGPYTWIGVIDDIYVYDQALSAAEIASLYDSTGGASVPEPQALFALGLALTVFFRARNRRGTSNQTPTLRFTATPNRAVAPPQT